MLKIFNYLYFTILFLLMVISCDSNSNSTHSKETFTIRAIIPLSGDLSQHGNGVYAALKLAVNDMNDKYAPDGKSFNLVYEDNETDEQINQSLFNTYIAQNIRIIIGPLSSTNLSSVVSTINNSNSVLISPSSTAPELAVEDDNIFRVISNDKECAKAIASKIYDQGIVNLVTIYRKMSGEKH